MHQLPHPGTLLTMAHTIWSSAVLIVLEGCVRVLVSALQHMPFDVRTMMLVVPAGACYATSCPCRCRVPSSQARLSLASLQDTPARGSS